MEQRQRLAPLEYDARIHHEEGRTNMKRSKKKNPPRASHKKAVRNLDVKSTKAGKVRGGATATVSTATVGRANFDVFTCSKG